MTTLASSLLDFILNLLRDPEAAAAYEEDPQAALEAAGLGDCVPADVTALLPMVAADHSPVAYGGGHEEPEHHYAPAKQEDHDKPDHQHTNDWSGHGHEAAVLHNVRYVENNYSHTERTEVEIDASNSIWVSGDAQAIFGDDNVLATGGSVAAGDDVRGVDIDNSVDNRVDVRDSFNDSSTDVKGTGNAVGDDAEVEDSFNTEVDVADSGNSYDVSGNGNGVGRNNDVETDIDTDIDTDISNSGNTQHGTGNVVGEDNEADNSTTVRDSFNEDNSTDARVRDSFNDNSTNTDVDVEFEESFNEDSSTDVDAEFEESFNRDNSTNTDVDAEFAESFNRDNSTNTDVDAEFDGSFNDIDADDRAEVDAG